MLILDSHGKPAIAPQEGVGPVCSKCGSDRFETTNGFGGYWTKACAKCSTVFAEGREGE